MAGKRTHKFRLRFYLILLVPVALLGALIGYRIINPTTGRLGSDTVEGDLEFAGVIIRRENVGTSEDYHSIRFLVEEGDLVADQQPVAMLYKKGYDNQMAEIISREQQIFQQQQTLLRLSSADGMTLPDQVLSYNEQIEQTVEQMTKAAQSKEGYAYAALAEELNQLLTARQALMRQIVPSDASLTASYQQLDILRSNFTAESTLYNNVGAGYVSFHLDGYESAMSVDSLTATQISRVVSSPVSLAYNAAGVYRVVDPSGFYIAFTVSSTDSHRLIVGNSYEVRVKYQDSAYTGRVIAERPAAKYVLYILEVNADVMPVLENRTMSFSIHTAASGVSIPTEGIYFSSGVPYVFLNTGRVYQPIEVVIPASDGDTAIIEAADKSIRLTRGLRFEYHEEEDSAATPAPTATPSLTPAPTATPRPTPVP